MPNAMPLSYHFTHENEKITIKLNDTPLERRDKNNLIEQRKAGFRKHYNKFLGYKEEEIKQFSNEALVNWARAFEDGMEYKIQREEWQYTSKFVFKVVEGQTPQQVMASHQDWLNKEYKFKTPTKDEEFQSDYVNKDQSQVKVPVDEVALKRKPNPEKAQEYCKEIARRLREGDDLQKKEILDLLNIKENANVKERVRLILLEEHKSLVPRTENCMKRWKEAYSKLNFAQAKIKADQDTINHIDSLPKDIKINDGTNITLAAAKDVSIVTASNGTDLVDQKITKTLKKYIGMAEVHQSFTKSNIDDNSSLDDLLTVRRSAAAVFESYINDFRAETDPGLRKELAIISAVLIPMGIGIVMGAGLMIHSYATTGSAAFWKSHTRTEKEVGEKIGEAPVASQVPGLRNNGNDSDN